MQQDKNTTTESLLNEDWIFETFEKESEIHIFERKDPAVAIASIYADPLEHEEYDRAKLICSAPRLAAENKALIDRVEKVNRLLHDLTPMGSQFVNKPEYCAKWIRENRLQEKQSLTKIIADLKKENERLKEALSYLLSSYRADFKNITGADLNDTEAVLKAKAALNQ